MTKNISLWIGIVAFIAGVLAFIPNGIVSATGFFNANVVTGIVDIILGIVFISVAYKNEKTIGEFFKVIGIIAVIVAGLCFLIAGSSGQGSLIGISFNDADSWLSLVVGIILIALAENISAKTKIIK